MICVVDRIIPAVGKHIVAEDALAGRNKDIGIDESTNLRIVIPALQVIQSGILSGRLAIQSNFTCRSSHAKPRVGYQNGGNNRTVSLF